MSDSQPILAAGKVPADLLGSLLDRHRVADPRVLVGPGIGRDSAAIEFGDRVLVVKSDPITFPSARPAFHLVHINANDIVCQGAIPRWLLVTALLPEGSTTAETISVLFSELNEAAAEIGVELIGGHSEITYGLDRPLLIGTMLGETTTAGLIDPAAAKPGDRILITKTAGIEGTALLAKHFGPNLLQSGKADKALIEAATAMIDMPGISVLAEARALAEAGAASALHDPTEGGIASAIRELATASNCGVLISRDAIPVAAETVHLAHVLSVDPLGLLSSGSLVASVPKDRIAEAEHALMPTGVPFAWIGKLTEPDLGLRMRTGTTETELPEFAVDEAARLLAG
jgi:hydrogenase expression/formation protein HypE